MTALNSTVDMYDLRMSDKARPLYDAVVRFIAEGVNATGSRPDLQGPAH